MARPTKPYLRKQTKSWYCSINGRQISLGKNREAAFEKFHELMADQGQVRDSRSTLYELSQVYLDWCEANRKPATYSRHRHYLKSFIESVGKRLRPSQLRVHQVVKWHEGLGVGTTTQNDAVAIVQRMLNWAVEQEYLSRNPIQRMKKPKRKRRDVCYTSEQWGQICAHAKGPLRQLLDFLYLTGCRPLEARSIEARHLHDDLVIFPADESKGEHEARVIYLVPEAKAILTPLIDENPTGPLFRNSRGNAWTKDSIKCQLTRISKKVGFRVIAYGARHSWATRALSEGGVDPISVAHLMGHRDPTMVGRVYSHLARNPAFLRQQAISAIGNEIEELQSKLAAIAENVVDVGEYTQTSAEAASRAMEEDMRILRDRRLTLERRIVDLESQLVASENALDSRSSDVDRLTALRNEQRDLEAELAELASSHRVFYQDRDAQGRRVFLVELVGEEVSVAEAGVDQPPQVFGGGRRDEAFTAWAKKQSSESVRFVVVVHRGQTDLFKTIYAELRSVGHSVGFDLLPDDVRAIDQKHGAG